MGCLFDILPGDLRNILDSIHLGSSLHSLILHAVDLSELERWEGWSTNRRNPPVLILGQRHGVELGIRQQRRASRLQTTEVEGLVVPTAREMLRVKAFLLAERRATRDYVDLAALVERLGESLALRALEPLNLLYPSEGPETLITRLAEACESEPVDLATIPLPSYKGLRAPFTDWAFVAEINQCLGRKLLKKELDGRLPKSLGDTTDSEGPL